MISQFGFVLLFFIAGILLVLVMIGLAKILRKDKPNPEKNTTYESGEETIGTAQVSFNMRFYIVAIIFLLFDVELVVLFPWATAFGDKNLIVETNGNWAWFAGVEMLLFVAILTLGLAYAWKKGHLEWIKPNQQKSDFKGVVPEDLYNNVNKKYS